jgi:hypothetical protein
MMIMTVITLWQPWASWVAEGWKTIETRTHTKFEGLAGGRILIHAGRQWDDQAVDLAFKYLTDKQRTRTIEFYGVRGKILCSAWVDFHVRCLPEDAKRALIECETERYGLLLSNIQKIEPPIPAKGKPGIWYYDLAAQPKEGK